VSHFQQLLDGPSIAISLTGFSTFRVGAVMVMLNVSDLVEDRMLKKQIIIR
jgi:hypothetical protein